MIRLVKFFALVSVLCIATSVANSQDKKVTISKITVNGKTVRSKFTIEIITSSKKVYKAKTDETGFVVPAEVLRENVDTYVGAIIRFQKFVLPFFTLHTSNFDATWLELGIKTKQFDKDDIGDADPSTIQSVNYIVFDGEPARRISVTTSKPTVTIQRIKD